MRNRCNESLTQFWELVYMCVCVYLSLYVYLNLHIYLFYMFILRGCYQPQRRVMRSCYLLNFEFLSHHEEEQDINFVTSLFTFQLTTKIIQILRSHEPWNTSLWSINNPLHLCLYIIILMPGWRIVHFVICWPFSSSEGPTNKFLT